MVKPKVDGDPGQKQTGRFAEVYDSLFPGSP
jgi:hypothetical protein